jgi:glucose/arabinose dehydrogenase
MRNVRAATLLICCASCGQSAPEHTAMAKGAFCSLPGSIIWGDNGAVADAGQPKIASWLHLPSGFCAHYFATVHTARQLRFADNGDLFVASPTKTTTGGAGDGIAGITVLPDDDHDGVADTNITFVDGLPSIQGLMFGGGYLYYQDDTTIRRVAVHPGDRQLNGSPQVVTTIALPQAPEHWPKVLDTAKDGTIYITNGSTQTETCVPGRQPFGAILKLEPDGSTSVVASGFRNPIALRCEVDHDVCLAAELAKDYSQNVGGREKLVVVNQGDDWGFPCCAGQGVPYADVNYADGGTPDCSGVANESAAFFIGHTPFGLDFEPGKWPAPWTGRVFVTLHGDAGSWNGARVVAIGIDSMTGLPLPAADFDAGADGSRPRSRSPGNLLEFASGWDDGFQDHGRPAPIAFAPDGRMFLGDDQKGVVLWIAPTTLMIP